MDKKFFDLPTTSISTYIYNPTEIIKGLRKENDELKKQIKDLEHLLQEYTDLHKKNNLSYIDGHCCYREITDAKIESVEMKPDYSGLYFNMKCKVVYKDVETHELIAIRHIEEEIGEGSRCTVI